MFDFDKEEFRQTGLLRSPEFGSEEVFNRRETTPKILIHSPKKDLLPYFLKSTQVQGSREAEDRNG